MHKIILIQYCTKSTEFTSMFVFIRTVWYSLDPFNRKGWGGIRLFAETTLENVV